MSALKMLAALALVVSPASLGIAAYTGAVDLDLRSSSEMSFNGEVIREETGAFDEEVTDGTLDLRVDRGAVRVIGWDKPEYRVVVVEEPHEGAEASDYETIVEFEDRSSGSTLDLKVIADRQGTHRVQQDGDGVRTGEHVDLAIVAWVPASADYIKVRACSGQDSFWNGAIETVDEALGEVAEVRSSEHDCVPAEDTPSTMGQISINDDGNSTGLNVTSGVVGLHGDLLRAFTSYGTIEAEQVDFETIQLESDYGGIELVDAAAEKTEAHTEYGAITAQNLETSDLDLASDYGDVEVDGTAEDAEIHTEYGDILLTGAFDTLDVATDYGAVRGDLDIQASGAYEIATEYGDVELSVPAQDAIGYDVQASTEYGDVEVDLEDASRQGESQDDEEDDGESAHVRTAGYDDRAIQVEMDITTDYGDVDVGHEILDLEEDDDEQDAGQDQEDHPAPTELPEVPTKLR